MEKPEVDGPAAAIRWPKGCQETQSIMLLPKSLILYDPVPWQRRVDLVSWGRDFVNKWRPESDPALMSPGLFGRKAMQLYCKTQGKALNLAVNTNWFIRGKERIDCKQHIHHSPQKNTRIFAPRSSYFHLATGSAFYLMACSFATLPKSFFTKDSYSLMLNNCQFCFVWVPWHPLSSEYSWIAGVMQWLGPPPWVKKWNTLMQLALSDFSEVLDYPEDIELEVQSIIATENKVRASA